MPLYNYECKRCQCRFEMVLPVAKCDDPQPCIGCGAVADKTIEIGHGGILRKGDSIPWVRSVGKILGPGINTVEDLRNFYKTHPNIVPKESHPALPSKLGDAMYKKPDQVELKKQRSKKAHEKLRQLRRITLTGQAA